nr:unnamed protein product [Callosobruchus analis]
MQFIEDDHTLKNGPFQDQLTKTIGPSLQLCHINVEGISLAKSECLSKLLLDNNVDVVLIQETHASTAEDLNRRGRIHGYELIGATYHNSYGVATYVRNNVEHAHLVSINSREEIHNVTIKVDDIFISNIYKSPNLFWQQPRNTSLVDTERSISQDGMHDVSTYMRHTVEVAPMTYRMTFFTNSMLLEECDGPKRLCGTTWGASADTLRTSSLALVNSTAEYCAPVWLNSCHTKVADVQLNNTMRLISGAVCPTPTYWLPLLSNLYPPQVRRTGALVKEFRKLQENPNLPLHSDIPTLRRNRLRSRKPPVWKAEQLVNNNVETVDLWNQNCQLIEDPEIPRRPLPHGDEIPIPKATAILQTMSSSSESEADQDNNYDQDFFAELGSETPKVFTQVELIV